FARRFMQGNDGFVRTLAAVPHARPAMGAAPPDSLKTGKITGNFRHFRPFRCVPSAFSVGLRCNTSALRMIPCSSLEQGIRLVEQGISSNETADSPILLDAFGSRIPLALFSAKTRRPAPISLGADQFKIWHRSQGGRVSLHSKIIYFIPQ